MPLTLEFLTERLELADQLLAGRQAMLEPQDLPGRYGRVIKAIDHVLLAVGIPAALAAAPTFAVTPAKSVLNVHACASVYIEDAFRSRTGELSRAAGAARLAAPTLFVRTLWRQAAEQLPDLPLAA